MLSINTETNNLIVENIRSFHKEGVLLPDYEGLGIWINASGNLQINYGDYYKKKVSGSIVIKRGQFEVIEVTNEAEDLLPVTYNHEGEPNTKGKYEKALKCTNLKKDVEKRTAIIYLTSESARSKMVLEAINKLLTDGVPFNYKITSGMLYAVTEYSKVAKAAGYNIHAGENATWEPLITKNYLDYIKELPKNVNKKELEENICAVQEYIDFNTNTPLKDTNNSDVAPGIVYPYSYTLETTEGKQFTFNFSFNEPSKNEACNKAISRYVSYQLLREDKPLKTETWEGCLQSDEEKPYKLVFEDNISIEGTMKLYKNGINSQDLLWLNVEYGFDLEEKFEGNIMIIPRG